MPKKGKNAQGTWAIRFLGLLTLAISGGIIYQTYTNPKFKGEQPIGAWIWFGVGLFLLFVPNPERESKDSRIICPHCHVRGSVTTQLVRRKKGISGGKATAAFLTGGFSILATGLSRKEDATEATCKNCGTIWYF